jgi:hypothetical protein
MGGYFSDWRKAGNYRELREYAKEEGLSVSRFGVEVYHWAENAAVDAVDILYFVENFGEFELWRNCDKAKGKCS